MTELDFVADGWYEIRGRGWVATMGGHQLPEGVNTPAVLRNRYVKIDGHEYWIVGVEMFASLTYNRRQGFGLLVRGPRIVKTVEVED